MKGRVIKPEWPKPDPEREKELFRLNAAKHLAEIVNARHNMPREARFYAAVIMASDPGSSDSVHAEMRRAAAARQAKAGGS